MAWQVPLFDTDIGEEECDAVMRVLKSGWVSMGEETLLFEREFAGFLGARHAFMVSNCTTALHLAHYILGAAAGDEVVCPSLTFVATANTIAHTGARPVFADIIADDTLTVSPMDIAGKITARTKGITVMHYGGYPCHMDEIMRIAADHRLYLVEDCAHSPGASYRGKMTGTFGDVGCFSFFSNKNLTTGEGGMIVTDRDDFAARIKLLRSHGLTTDTLDRHKGHSAVYDVLERGFNYRPAEFNAALGRVQLKKLGKKNRARQQIVSGYRTLLSRESRIVLPFGREGRESQPADHIFPVVLEEGVDREAVMQFLKEKGIQTSIHYRPIHTFATYRDDTRHSLPATDLIKDRLLTLPLYPAMTESQVEYVVENLIRAIR